MFGNKKGRAADFVSTFIQDNDIFGRFNFNDPLKNNVFPESGIYELKGISEDFQGFIVGSPIFDEEFTSFDQQSILGKRQISAYTERKWMEITDTSKMKKYVTISRKSLERLYAQLNEKLGTDSIAHSYYAIMVDSSPSVQYGNHCGAFIFPKKLVPQFFSHGQKSLYPAIKVHSTIVNSL